MMQSSLCSAVGLKPTAGQISRSGTIPISFTREAIGPIVRTVADSRRSWAEGGSSGSRRRNEDRGELVQHCGGSPRVLELHVVGAEDLSDRPASLLGDAE